MIKFKNLIAMLATLSLSISMAPLKISAWNYKALYMNPSKMHAALKSIKKDISSISSDLGPNLKPTIGTLDTMIDELLNQNRNGAPLEYQNLLLDTYNLFFNLYGYITSPENKNLALLDRKMINSVSSFISIGIGEDEFMRMNCNENPDISSYASAMISAKKEDLKSKNTNNTITLLLKLLSSRTKNYLNENAIRDPNEASTNL